MALFNHLYMYGSNAIATSHSFLLSLCFNIHVSISAGTASKTCDTTEQDIQQPPPQATMTKTAAFKAYDLRRKNSHIVGGTIRPAKISSHRLNREDWAVTKAGTRASLSRRAKKATPVKTAVLEVISYDRGDWHCRVCDKSGDDPDCDSSCYKQFKRDHFLADDAIDIKWTGERMGYATFTGPGTHLKKGQYLGEYIGDLKPIDHDNGSRFAVEVPGVCVIDAAEAGNWTRFINSSCEPNVNARWDIVGKRHVIVFSARRAIGPEEELTFSYGPRYFEALKMQCDCGVVKGPHAPKGPVRRRSADDQDVPEHPRFDKAVRALLVQRLYRC